MYQLILPPVSYEEAYFLHPFANTAYYGMYENLMEDCILFSLAFLKLLIRLKVFSHVSQPFVFLSLFFNTVIF